jgi:hypothetical protein
MQPSSLLRKLDHGATPGLQIPLGEPGPITIAGLAAITLPGPIWDQLARAVTPGAVPSAAAESDASGSPTLCQSGTALGARPSGISRRTGQGDSQCRAIYSLVTPAAPAIVRGHSKLRNAHIFDDKRPKKCFQKSFPKYSFSHMSLLQNRSESLPSSSLPV